MVDYRLTLLAKPLWLHHPDAFRAHTYRHVATHWRSCSAQVLVISAVALSSYRSLAMLSCSWTPEPHTEGLATRVKKNMSEKESYRERGDRDSAEGDGG